MTFYLAVLAAPFVLIAWGLVEHAGDLRRSPRWRAPRLVAWFRRHAGGRRELLDQLDARPLRLVEPFDWADVEPEPWPQQQLRVIQGGRS